MKALRKHRGGAEGGFVLLVVLFVLLALFALTAPFLGTARNADAASHFDKDAAQLRLALDGAGRHARFQLGGSHIAVDPTPYFDDEAELTVEVDFPAGTPGVSDPNGVAWDVDSWDLAGRVDINSASPQVLANLLGAVARLSAPAAAGDKALKVSNAGLFAPEEVIVVEGELIQLGEPDKELKGSSSLKVEQRGVGAIENKDGDWETNGPLPPREHGIGAYVFDQRMLAPVTWRTLSVDGRPQVIDAVEEIRASEDFSMNGGFGDGDLRVLRRSATPFGSIGGGPEWQRPTRLTTPLEGGESYILRVAEGRWLGTGSTIKIENGITTELRVVMNRSTDGTVILDRTVDYDYEAFVTEVSVLAKRPVNLNTATPEVLAALFANLKLRRQNHRIQESEARALASMVVQSRPFDSLEDFLRRIVLPAAGIDELPKDASRLPSALEEGTRVLDDARDAVALYYNALNANDARLEFATMPFDFTTRGVFEFELRANVSAKSGVQRTSGVRERVELVVPQSRELLHLFARQEDFDAQLRLTRNAPYWLTGPNATGRYDAGVYPPSRSIPHLGTLEGASYVPGVNEPVLDGDENVIQAERIFASRTEQSYLQLDPVRVQATGRSSGRILHFDLESRSLEGRFLPDELVVRPAADPIVRWVADPSEQVVQPLALSMWVKPSAGSEGTLMSLGSGRPDSDRVVLGMDGANLTLRVFDGMGDHRDTTFEEVAEVKMPIASGTGGAGLPVDVWSHVFVDVRGNRPDQMSMIVNGNANGVQVDGMTRLIGGLASGSSTIGVESTEGFPAVCTLRIGSEIIEATVSGPNTFLAQHQTSGANGGFGGRLARVPFDLEGTPTAVPSAVAAAGVSGNYAAGTPVVNYGYSLPVTDDFPGGGGQLGGDIGPWRVARVVGDPSDTSLEPIQVVAGLDIVDLGQGWDETSLGSLNLSLGDSSDLDPSGSLVSAGFNPGGGYAALFGRRFNIDGSGPQTPTGFPLGGIEIIRYSGVAGGQLQVIQRNVVLQRQTESPNPVLLGGARQFVFNWNPNWINAAGTPLVNKLDFQTFCIPISVAVPGANPSSFRQPAGPNSEFAQITRLDDPEQTEWIRYDEIDASLGQLVRSDPQAFVAAYLTFFLGNENIARPIPPGGGGQTGGLVDPGGGFVGPTEPSSSPAPPAPSASAAVGPSLAQQSGGADWDPLRGTDPNDNFPLTRTIASVFHFRGVLGTNMGEHSAGTDVLPVTPIRVNPLDFEMGRPGAKDAVFAVDGTLADLGRPVTIHRAHYPAENRVLRSWVAPPEGLVAAAGADQTIPVTGYESANIAYVAFETSLGLPLSPGAAGSSLANATDPRFLARLVKFPSGELPRAGGDVTIGAGSGGQQDFGPAAMEVDEIIFGGATTFGGAGGTAPVAHAAGAPLVLASDMGVGDQNIPVQPSTIRLADRSINVVGAVGEFPADGGLVRIGEEIIAYQALSTGTGGLQVAVNGRGVLGTQPQAHAVTEPVHWLEGWEVSTLVADIGPDDAALPVTSIQDFGLDGTVLVNSELIHFTRNFGGALVMPRSSGEPGAMDQEGPGVFRGRFGTAPASHAAGSSVISFPARYWDRYAPRFDGADLGFFGLYVDQPGAFWNGVFWDAQEGQTGGAEIVVLQRTDPNVPWDADPEEVEGLTLLENGDLEGDLIPIGAQSDRIEWRIFARYTAGAFDPAFGASHGWKESPRFIQLGATYTAAPRIYRSVDR